MQSAHKKIRLILRGSAGLLVALIGLGSPAILSAQTTAACPDDQKIIAANNDLLNERLTSARTLRAHKDTCTNHVPFQFMLARLNFLEGKYEQSLARLEGMDRTALVAPWKGAVAQLYDLVFRTAELTRGYERYASPDGVFEIRFPRGKDAVLVPYIKESFPKMIKSIGAILSYTPNHPIRIEIYEAPQGLAAATGLTANDIETSGTIALCKYRKLMITSPKALVHGYGWLDTLSHEYVHYVIQRLSGNKVPIWLHEAYAKYLESRWRSERSLPMNPSSQHRLRKAIRKRSLISFQEMSPSMAKLPSQEHTALAFAEVYTVGQYLESIVGPAGMRRLIDLMATGRSDREAISEVTGGTYLAFKRAWKRSLRRQKWRSVPAGLLDVVSFKNRKEPREELTKIGEKIAEDFTYLGDLLRARKRPIAASHEYRKASKRTRGVNPIIQAKLAGALLDIGQHQEAYSELDKPLEHYPDDFMLQRNRGRAARALGKTEEAISALRAALRKNPFDVEIHRILAEVADEQGETQRAKIERDVIRLLSIE
jgi:tetratricopeptide (TPR) repeat protein